jgi:alkyl hydroperoxide reductase subunit AhpF
MTNDSLKKEDIQDVIIIGGGPAGLTAGIYAARARLATLLIEKLGIGGQTSLTDKIENYPGFTGGISGPELVHNMDRINVYQLLLQQAISREISMYQVNMNLLGKVFPFAQPVTELFLETFRSQ